MSTIIARRRDWLNGSTEHLLLTEGPDQIVAESAILGTIDEPVFAAR